MTHFRHDAGAVLSLHRSHPSYLHPRRELPKSDSFRRGFLFFALSRQKCIRLFCVSAERKQQKSLRIILWHDLHFLAVMYNKDKMVLECVWHGVCPFAGEKEGERDREYYREAVCPAAV